MYELYIVHNVNISAYHISYYVNNQQIHLSWSNFKNTTLKYDSSIYSLFPFITCQTSSPLSIGQACCMYKNVRKSITATTQIENTVFFIFLISRFQTSQFQPYCIELRRHQQYHHDWTTAKFHR